MRLPILELIRRLASAAKTAKDPDIEVEFDGIFYLHSSNTRPHLIELVNIPKRNESFDEVRKLKEEIERLEKELTTYKQAYG